MKPQPPYLTAARHASLADPLLPRDPDRKGRLPVTPSWPGGGARPQGEAEGASRGRGLHCAAAEGGAAQASPRRRPRAGVLHRDERRGFGR